MHVRDETFVSPAGPFRDEAIKVVFTLSGWAQVTSAHETVQLAAGTVLTIGSGLECWGTPAGIVRTGTFYFHPAFLADHIRWLPAMHPLVHLLRDALDGGPEFGKLQLPESTMQHLAVRLSQLTRLEDHPGEEFLLIAATADLLHALGRAAGAAVRNEMDAAIGPVMPRLEVARAAGLLFADLTKSWRIEDLAREVALSVSQLGRLFRTGLGISPAAYLGQLRADRMAELLAGARLSVSDAAHAVGWQNGTVAARVFKRRYGVSPREFATRHRSWAGAEPDRP